MNNLTSISLLLVLLSVALSGCNPKLTTGVESESFPQFYKEGHRGTRGHMPENTIPAMKKAIDLGANVLEMDVQISKDGKVVIAHDPYINPDITTLNGNAISKEEAKKYVLHQMNYSDIRAFDVGSKDYPNFPKQKKMHAYMPLLGELIDSVEQYTSEKNLDKVIYNVEIKANPEKDGIYQPMPDELISKVMEVINSKDIDNRFYIQSFDIRQIQEVHKNYPEVVIGFLTSDKEATFVENIKDIGFFPQIYSPHYQLASRELIQQCHAQNIKFVPWTVNTLDEMKKLKQINVDGMITDYPDLFDQLE